MFSKVLDTESEGDIFKMSLNDKAVLLSENGEPQNQDISLLIQELVESGFTSGTYAAATDIPEDVGSVVKTQPLLAEEIVKKEETDRVQESVQREAERLQEPVQRETEPVKEVTVEQTESKPELETEPVIEVAVTEPVVEAEPESEPDPNRVVFRVQILSRSKANSNPSVTIAGTRYQTFEYFYKGAYRVTVGEFETVQEASTFRAKCKNSGFDQAFVAAFRGSERETDPSVFRR